MMHCVDATHVNEDSSPVDPVKIQYRPATMRDMEAVLRLWGAMMDFHQNNDPRIQLAPGALNAYRAYASYQVNRDDAFLHVAESGGDVIGFILLSISRNLPMFEPPLYGYLSDLTVDAGWRRRGIGRELVRRGCEWLRRHNVTTVQLQFYQFNRQGESFWRAVGFEPYYTRMWLDIP